MFSFSNLLTFMMSLVGRLGYLGVFLVIGLEYACFPIPSEIVLPFVGMSIPQTTLSFFPSFMVSLLAGLVGSLICYAIGLWGGIPLLNKLETKSQGLSKALNLFNQWFNVYGRWAVLFSRVIPLTRTYISLFAGVNHMALIEFLLYSASGIALWNLVLMSLGFYLGSNWALIEGILDTYSNIVLVIIALALIGYLGYIWHQKRQEA